MSTDKNEQKKEDLKPEPNFSIFVSSLSMQTLIFLGEIDNPLTHKKETNPEQAKYMIDTLSMLKEKTKGNLSGHEANLLDNVLYELRMKYTAAAGKL